MRVVASCQGTCHTSKQSAVVLPLLLPSISITIIQSLYRSLHDAQCPHASNFCYPGTRVPGDLGRSFPVITE
eukprot:1693541-Rhodomonas_salina.1